jgi:hypothetical protein
MNNIQPHTLRRLAGDVKITYSDGTYEYIPFIIDDRGLRVPYHKDNTRKIASSVSAIKIFNPDISASEFLELRAKCNQSLSLVKVRTRRY